MAQEYIRFTLDLAIPKVDWDEAPAGQRNKIRLDILDIKDRSAKINQGNPNEENTTRAKWHLCRHEFGDSSCNEQDVTEDDPDMVITNSIKGKIK